MTNTNIYLEGQGKRNRPDGYGKMWQSDELFQPIQGGHNLVLPLDYRDRGDHHKKFRYTHEVQSKHSLSQYDMGKMEHRQVYIPKWLDPWVEEINSHPFAKASYSLTGQNSEIYGLSISPNYDLFASQILMFIFYQGSVIHNWSKWLKETFPGSGWDIDNIAPSKTPMGHYISHEGGYSIIDRIEMQGWEMVRDKVFDWESERNDNPHPDYLWYWDKHKVDGEDWASTSTNPSKAHKAPSEIIGGNSVLKGHKNSGPAVVFGPEIGRGHERRKRTFDSGSPYSQEPHSLYGGSFHGKMPLGRQWTMLFEQYEFKRLGLNKK